MFFNKALFVFFLFSYNIFFVAQNNAIDSLKRELRIAKHDTVRVKIYASLSELCDINEIPLYCHQGLKICEAQIQNGNDRDVLFFYKPNKGVLLSNLSYYHKYIGEVQKSIEYNFKSLEIFDELKDSLKSMLILNNISVTYSDIENYTLSQKYYQKCLEIANKKRDLGMISSVFSGIAVTNQRLGKYKVAKENDSLALAIRLKENDSLKIAESYSNLSIDYIGLNDYKKGIEYGKRSLAIYKLYNKSFELQTVLVNLGEAYLRTSNYTTAQKYLSEGMSLAKQIGNPLNTATSCFALSRLYSKTKNYEEAYKMLLMGRTLFDSIANDKLRRNATAKDIQYEYDKKSLQDKLTQEKIVNEIKLEAEKKDSRKNLLLLSLLSVLVLIVLGALFFYRNYRQTQSIKELEKNELKQKVLLSQMNPHFIYNSMTNIKSLIRNKDDERAINYLDEFSLLTRQVLEHSRENYISLEEEVSMLTNYLNIQQLLLNNSFTYNISVSEQIKQDYTFVPPMLVQPFVENAIKHGAREGIKGNIEIQFTLDTNNKLLVRVKDNGKGFSDKQIQKEHKSLALKITKQRLEQYNANTSIVFENVIAETGEVLGAKISFEMPYIYEG